jgi:hypothetical protein
MSNLLFPFSDRGAKMLDIYIYFSAQLKMTVNDIFYLNAKTRLM